MCRLTVQYAAFMGGRYTILSTLPATEGSSLLLCSPDCLNNTFSTSAKCREPLGSTVAFGALGCAIVPIYQAQDITHCGYKRSSGAALIECFRVVVVVFFGYINVLRCWWYVMYTGGTRKTLLVVLLL